MKRTIGTKEDHIVTLTGGTFGHTDSAGLQHKGAVLLDNQETYVKLDDLNPADGREWENKFDYRYSSVSEAIVSCLTRNINSDTFKSADYRFAVFDNDGKQSTGTYSKNYLNENEVEWLLSTGYKSGTNVSVELDEYVQNVVDSPFATKFKSMVKYFTDLQVDEDLAKEFIIQQSAFDTLTGNTDRLMNPSNFVVTYNVETKSSTPINIDYGRCLQLDLWSDNAESNFQIGSEYYAEDIKEFARTAISKNQSLLSGLKTDEIKQVLSEYQFEPFDINYDQVMFDLDDLATTIKSANLPFEKFALVKIDTFKQMLDTHQDLWCDFGASVKSLETIGMTYDKT